MFHLANGASSEKDVDRNEPPHTPPKIYHNINKYTVALLTVGFSLWWHSSTPAAAVRVYNIGNTRQPILHDCDSMDIRNDCEGLRILENCTAVTGFLLINMIRKDDCNFTEYSYPNLREITDFLLVKDVQNLTTFKDLFPSLTVIRGRRLFTNYALTLTEVHQLERLEFRSLLTISRGHVYIDGTPQLCSTEGINFDRLTARVGVNNIFLNKTAECPPKVICTGCRWNTCWSTEVCQKFDDDSILSPWQNVKRECHKQCLGGCYNATAKDCVVCKNYMDHGTCVDKCPADKYPSKHYLRCYTRGECVAKSLYLYNGTCVDYCPLGFKADYKTRECLSCDVRKKQYKSDSKAVNATGEDDADFIDGKKICFKVCGKPGDTFFVSSIMDIELLKGCHIVNASIIVSFHQYVDPQEFKENLQYIKEITGYLKIDKCVFFNNFNFFQNLEKIHGDALEYDQYGLIIYNNKNATQFWDVKPGFELVHGGIYIDGNDRMCNHRIKKFRESIKHDNSLDTYQKSDRDVLCSPAKLNLYLEVLNHTSIKLLWPKRETLEEIEILYKPLSYKEETFGKNDIDIEVCERVKWHREVMFSDELDGDDTKFIYIVKSLQPHTRYAFLVKTFDGDDDSKEARSQITYGTTNYDIPAAPKITLISKTSESLYLNFSADNTQPIGSQVVDFFLFEVHNVPDDKKVLDSRNYCNMPVINYSSEYEEDYDDCCSRREKERVDETFISRLKQEFRCSQDQPEYCTQSKVLSEYKNRSIYMQRIERWSNHYNLTKLQSFHLYVVKAYACNYNGCSSPSIMATRTNYSLEADRATDFSACKMLESYDYHVNFSEPILHNGYITSYTLHFRYIENNDESMPTHNHVVCITRLEHERKKYKYKGELKYPFNQAGVRVHSLGHSSFIEWSPIKACNEMSTSVSHIFWLIFLLLLSLGIVAVSIYFVYIRGYLHRYFPYLHNWSYFMNSANTVRFHNIPEEDRVYFLN